jgi:hypothetical protein
MGPSKKAVEDPGLPSGDWLVRHDALVIGPLPGAQVVEKLYAGELDGRSEISKMGSGLFQQLSSVDGFKVHLAKADAKRRVDAQAHSQAKASRSSRNLKIGLVVAVAVMVAGAMGIAMKRLAERAPWKNADELAYADLIEVEAPVITRTKARASDEELVDYPGTTKRPGVTPPEKVKPGARPDKTPVPSTPKTPKPGSDDPDGLQMAQVDQEAINSVVRTKQRTLFPCLAAEAQKKPGLAARIPIEFTVGNEGRVTKLWVDNPQFKEGSLPECLMRELQKWQFKPNESGGATVSLSFKLGKGA